MSRLREIVHSLAPACSPVYLEGLDAATTSLASSGLGDDKPLRQSHFLGQFLGETGGGHVLQESGNYTSARLMEIFGVGRHSAAITRAEAEKLCALSMPAKEKAIFERVYGAGNPHKMRELGNRPGDGWPMRGTGPLQSTGRGAAKRWGDRLGITFTDNQLWMLEPGIIFKPSLFEWDHGSLNIYADTDDGRKIRRFINGAYNGLADCEAWQNKAYAALRDPTKHATESWAEAMPSTDTSALQNSLNLLGADPKIKVDGRYGPATKAAVAWFQKIAGLNVDGVAGPVTRTAINLRFATKRGA